MTPPAGITKSSLPDHDGTPIVITNDRGEPIGTLTFEKGTSRLEYAPGQLPHRAMVSKRKHRRA